MFKKVILLVAAALLIALPVAAYDFGGSLDVSGGTAITEVTTISPAAKATGWVKVPFGAATLSAEAYYKWSGSFVSGSDPVMTNIADLSLLKVSFAIPAGSMTLNMNAGRYSFADVSGSVFAMTSDGINLGTSAGLIKIGGYAGYTGLLNAKTTNISAAPAITDEGIYVLAPKYVVFLANAALPNFLGGNTFTFEATGAVDLNEESEGYTKSNRFYGTLSAAGPITTSIYYSACATGSFLTDYEEKAGFFGKGSVVCYLPVMSLAVTASGAYGSENFKAISYNPYAGGILDAGISATLKPINSLLCMVMGNIDCSTVDSFAATNATWTALAKWQALSDVSATLSFGQDIPLTDEGTSRFTASVSATVSF